MSVFFYSILFSCFLHFTNNESKFISWPFDGHHFQFGVALQFDVIVVWATFLYDIHIKHLLLGVNDLYWSEANVHGSYRKWLQQIFRQKQLNFIFRFRFRFVHFNSSNKLSKSIPNDRLKRWTLSEPSFVYPFFVQKKRKQWSFCLSKRWSALFSMIIKTGNGWSSLIHRELALLWWSSRLLDHKCKPYFGQRKSPKISWLDIVSNEEDDSSHSPFLLSVLSHFLIFYAIFFLNSNHITQLDHLCAGFILWHRKYCICQFIRSELGSMLCLHIFTISDGLTHHTQTYDSGAGGDVCCTTNPFNSKSKFQLIRFRVLVEDTIVILTILLQ